jgi:nucleotidyltransferase substrate binding protein (TIGR01987 family)
MGRLTERLAVARRALDTLCELPLGGTPTKVERDAAIQRFEYSFEAVWKAGQHFLREVEGIDPGSPKGTVRAALQVGLLDEADARMALEMVDDRNLTVHTYNEALAERIFSRLQAHAATMIRFLDAIEKRDHAA